MVVDHETYYMKFNGRSKFFEDLLIPDENTFKIIESMYNNIQEESKKVEIAVKKYTKIKSINDFKLLRINRQTVGDWGYASSKITRIAHELIDTPRITLSEMSDGFSYRCDGVDFSGVDLIKILKDKFPHAMVNGGGHDVAGSIRFNIASYDEIMNYVLYYLENIK